MINKIATILEKIATMCMQQLPLFIMLVIYTTAPTFFNGAYSHKTYLITVLPQVVLPSLLLCVAASWRRWCWWVVFVLANMLWLIETGCYFCEHQRMSSYIALIIAQSNPGESGEFLSHMYANIVKTVLTVAASAAVFYIFDRIWRVKTKDYIHRARKGKTQIAMVATGVILILSVIYSPVTLYAVTLKSKSFSQRITRPILLENASTWIMYGYILIDTLGNPNLKALPQLAETLAETQVSIDGSMDSLKVVYVIGESFTRNRSSLYGYPYETNPLMAKELADSALILFDNVISHWHLTSGVYRCMLSTCDIQDDRPFETYPLLPALMKKAGYKVAYLDNQKSISNGVGDAECTYFLGEYKIRDLCLDMYNDGEEEYDADFVNKYESPYIDGAENSLTIYHLMGQHLVYHMRYPESFTHFTKADYMNYEGLSERGAEVMATYDNATLYNDYTLHSIIGKLRDKTAILIYSSDHGEEAYDYREVASRAPECPVTSVRLYYEVPVMIWMSDSFRQKYPGIVAALRDNTHKAIYNSDLPHTILDITGINTATFNPDVSLLRDGKGRTHRHVIAHDTDYDGMHDEIYSQKMRYEQ